MLSRWAVLENSFQGLSLLFAPDDLFLHFRVIDLACNPFERAQIKDR